MPDIRWKEIDDIIHKCKNTLQIAYTIEARSNKTAELCQKMRERLAEELKKINDIIERQPDEGANNE